MNAYYKGQPVFGPRGPAGPDGNPIGTVISFMGVSAPADYLVCDGAQYSISQYPALASFFEAQFGTKNHFGGDGEATFAVPDMRNLFLRGYHGEAEEQLSGDIGVRQEATSVPHVNATSKGNASFCCVFTQEDIQYPDSIAYPSEIALASPQSWDNNTISYGKYTARPANMAVLYCIKAAETSGGATGGSGGGSSAGEVYSTEETKIGTWFGKPLYRKGFRSTTNPTNNNYTYINIDGLNISEVANLYGLIHSSNGFVPVYFHFSDSQFVTATVSEGKISVLVKDTTLTGKPVTAILEYTKTTD